MEVTETKNVTGKRRTALVYAPPKSGKTCATATMSEHCPETLPAPELTDLPDILYIQFDPNGTDSLRSLNLSAPLIDLSSPNTDDPNMWNTEDGAKKILTQMRVERREALKLIGERVRDGVTKTVIIDTATMYNADRLALLQTIFPNAGQNNQKYNNLLMEHIKLMNPLKDLGCHLIVTGHAKVLSEPMSNDAKQVAQHASKVKAGALPGSANIVPGLTGQALDKWRSAVSNVWPVVMVRSASKVKEVYIRPYGGDSFEGGSRVAGLEMKEPAHLRLLFDKIDKLNGVT